VDLSPPVVAAVIPALDEEAVIGAVVDALLRGGRVDQVIVVDNGSRDRTAQAARDAGALVVSEPRRGYGRACRSGVGAASGAGIILLLDGDGSDRPEDIPALLDPLLRDEADLVVGTRVAGLRQAGSMTPQQLLGNALAGTIIRTLLGLAVTDLGPLRAIRRQQLLGLEMSEMTYGWSVEMVVKAARAGLRYREVPVGYRRRVGVSKVGGTVRGSVKAGVSILSTIARHRAWRPEMPR
jgi:glycosyltransferase involved in cell wall biosynthesis